jgi:hypothetical protein
LCMIVHPGDALHSAQAASRHIAGGFAGIARAESRHDALGRSRVAVICQIVKDQAGMEAPARPNCYVAGMALAGAIT